MINLFYPEREIMVIRKIVREKKKKREDRSTPPEFNEGCVPFYVKL